MLDVHNFCSMSKLVNLDDLRHLNFTLSMSFLSSLAYVVDFLNEEKSPLLKLVQ